MDAVLAVESVAAREGPLVVTPAGFLLSCNKQAEY